MSNSLSDSISPIVKEAVDGLAYPQRCTVVKVYSNGYVDILLDGRLVRYVETVGGSPVVEGTGIIVFLNNSFDDYVVIV